MLYLGLRWIFPIVLAVFPLAFGVFVQSTMSNRNGKDGKKRKKLLAACITNLFLLSFFSVSILIAGIVTIVVVKLFPHISQLLRIYICYGIYDDCIVD